ncbi:MAG: hypothetical protein DMG06_01370 [Acidobacteria bacterium]|nr:MAG: hypothetical protein DMG06_01370 [Acidobacteriota bacterium]
MYCPNCGQSIAAESKFCSGCGTAVTPSSLPPHPEATSSATNDRMAIHVKVLGWIYLGFGFLGCVVGVMAFLLFSAVGTRFSGWHDLYVDRHFPPALGFLGLGALIGAMALIFSLPGLIAGYGLLKYKEWARILTIILCFLNLLNIPFGTILGAYGLWVLLSREGERHYRQQADILWKA